MSESRRRWVRVPAEALPGVEARLTSGIDVRLIDLSQGGARFKTRERLLPGLNVSLRFTTGAEDQSVRGKVVRSSMVKLADGRLGYEVGVAFDEVLSGALAEIAAAAVKRVPRGRRTDDRTGASLDATVTVVPPEGPKDSNS
jgi:hypothetical protein